MKFGFRISGSPLHIPRHGLIALIIDVPIYISRYFDGSNSHIDPRFYDPNFDNIVEVINLAATHPQTLKEVRDLISSDYDFTNTSVTNSITPIYFHYGWPLQGRDKRCTLKIGIYMMSSFLHVRTSKITNL